MTRHAILLWHDLVEINRQKQVNYSMHIKSDDAAADLPR